MTARDGVPPDPSMQDILASIRQILSDDEQSGSDPAPLDLTEAMLVPVTPTTTPATTPATPPPMLQLPPPQHEAVSVPAPVEVPAPLDMQALMAPAAAAATAAALGELARAVAGERQAPVSRGGASIEDVVREEIRPLLKAWLDQHLPETVERLVKAEIARVMGRSGG